jgi:acetyl-CoA carboxylase biotin carboxyl carrier protein
MTVPFDPAAVRALAMILADTGLTEIEIEGKEGKIRVVRAAPTVMAAPAQTHVAAAPVVVSAAPTPAADEATRDAGAVRSPMVGVAYLAPEPGASPFVMVGQTVAAGQTLLLIEAMKTFNQIKAPRAGTVTRILVTPGSPVEYDEPLLILE